MSATTQTLDQTFRRDARVIGIVGIAHGTSHFFHLILAPLFPWLKVQFGLSYAELGLLMTMFFVVSGTGQALAGFVVDRIGAYPVLVTGVGLLVLSAVVLALAPTYPALMAGAMIAGLGNSVFHPADYTLLNKRVSSGRIAHAFSAHGLAGTLGWALAPVFLVGIATALDWRSALWAAALLAAVVLASLLAFRDLLGGEHPVDPAERRNAGAPRESALRFLRLPAVWMCFGFFAISAMALGGIQSFAPAAMKELYDAPLAVTSGGITAYMLASALGIVVGGFIASKHRHHDHVIAASFVVAALTAWTMATGLIAVWLLFLPLAVMGFAAGVAGPSRDLLVRAASPRNATGRVYGVVYSGLDIGLSVSPLLFGAVMDAHHPAWLFMGVGLFQLLALATALGIGGTAARKNPET